MKKYNPDLIEWVLIDGVWVDKVEYLKNNPYLTAKQGKLRKVKNNENNSINIK